MNSLRGSQAGNSATEVSATTLPGVVPHPAAAVDRYMATGAWGTRSLPTAYRQAATTYAERTALITPDMQLTYRELDARSDAVAGGLVSSGLLPGERVLLQLTNSAAAVVAWYGLLKAGLIPVCTLAIHRRLEIEQIGRKSGAVAHLVQADFPRFDLVGLGQEVAGLLPAMRQLLTVGAAPGTPGLRIEDLQDHEVAATEQAGLRAIAESLDVHGPAVLQLSGGTTGTPKIIPRLHAEYRYNADLTSRWWGHTEHSVLAFGLPLAHNAALTNGLHAAHGAGAAFLLATPAAGLMLPLMAEHGATWTMSPPGLAREYLSHPAFGDATARLGTWVLTAARVARSAFDELTARGVHVTQAFGMSEGIFLFTPLDAPADLRAETVGVPISPLDEVRVLRPGTEVEAAEGETGELAARGPYTIRGYLAAPDRDREAFTAEGFYRSGDLVRVRRYQGTLSYSVEGRVKDLIDRGGEKINAEEVELLVAGHPGVAEMALVGMPDPRLGERGCAYIVPRDPRNPPALADICAYLEAAGLAKYKWPERLELIDALPRTQVGKISKVTLRADIGAKLEHETSPGFVCGAEAGAPVGPGLRSLSPALRLAHVGRCRRASQGLTDDPFTCSHLRGISMALYMYQASYTAKSMAAQLKEPQDPVEAISQALEDLGAQIVVAGFPFGEYDVLVVYDAPDDMTAASVAMAVAAEGEVKSAKTTRLLSGQEWLESLRKRRIINTRRAVSQLPEL